MLRSAFLSLLVFGAACGELVKLNTGGTTSQPGTRCGARPMDADGPARSSGSGWVVTRKDPTRGPDGCWTWPHDRVEASPELEVREVTTKASRCLRLAPSGCVGSSIDARFRFSTSTHVSD